MYKKIAVVTLLVVLGLVNWSIYGKEKHLAAGEIVYLELAPIDPRSLMQGDYMALRFRVADEVYKALPKIDDTKHWRNKVRAPDGYAVVSLDEKSIATFKYIYNEQPLLKNELRMRYRVRHGTVKFATNAFFFQEGHSAPYQAARYGQFRVDSKGELLLAAMYDKNMTKLGAE